MSTTAATTITVATKNNLNNAITPYPKPSTTAAGGQGRQLVTDCQSRQALGLQCRRHLVSVNWACAQVSLCLVGSGLVG